MGKKNKERLKSTSCGGVVWRLKEGKLELLLIKQFAHKDRWGIPKGHKHSGESLEDCAKREIREETGVNVSLSTRLPNTITTYKREDKTVAAWLAQPVGDESPHHDDPESEVADARWFSVQSMPEIHAYQRPVIATAIEMLTKIVENIK